MELYQSLNLLESAKKEFELGNYNKVKKLANDAREKVQEELDVFENSIRDDREDISTGTIMREHGYYARYDKVIEETSSLLKKINKK